MPAYHEQLCFTSIHTARIVFGKFRHKKHVTTCRANRGKLRKAKKETLVKEEARFPCLRRSMQGSAHNCRIIHFITDRRLFAGAARSLFVRLAEQIASRRSALGASCAWSVAPT